MNNNSIYDPSFPFKEKGEITFSLILFFIGFNIYYILPFIFQSSQFSAVENTVRYYVPAFLLMIGAALIEVFKSRKFYLSNISYTAWILFFVIIIFFIFFLSVIAGHSKWYSVKNAVAYLCLVLIPAFAHKRFYWPLFNRMFIVHTLIGCLFNLYVFFFKDISFRTAFFSTEGYNAMSSSLYAGHFLIITLPIQSKWGKRIGILSAFVLMINAILINKRLLMLMVPFDILLVLYIMSRMKLIKKTLSKLFVICIIFSAPLLLISGIAYKSIDDSQFSNKISTGIEKSKERFLAEGSVVSTVTKNVRWAEIKAAANKMSLLNWILGKGVAATWSHPELHEGKERRVIHVSYFQFIYHGGIIFLFLILIPLIWTIKSFFNTSNPLAVCCGSFLITRFLTMASYSIIQWSLDWILFSLCLGACLQTKPNKKGSFEERESIVVHKYAHAGR